MSDVTARLRRRPMLLIEALVALAVASALIAVLPFRTVAKLAAGQGSVRQLEVPEAEAQWIARAVCAWATRVPWRAVCFQQGLAAILMLRRRRRTANLYYGAAHGAEAKLVAHVWIKSGPIEVIGCETADSYALLAVFPDQSR